MAPGREEQVQEQQYHHNAHALHEVDMHPGAREPTEISEQQRVKVNQRRALHPLPESPLMAHLRPAPQGTKVSCNASIA
jgi:hypothetical protein